ncbi:hypothetical protein SLEP1_g36954 [Rubroshorea leprosula]|uniref:Uncharacterized protein n=1 Tax=Rubroshorea leprosula TaxID=152421 RepID=A0AAV5KTK5_9ROSI|nr:hypothetical protein SLEP1_g36954 [Rubroshorea leprosula]
MEKVKFPLLILLVGLFVLPEVKCHQKLPLPTQSPLCNSQFALANHACAFLPLIPLPPLDIHPSSDDNGGEGHNHRHRHGHGHHRHGHHHGHHQHRHGESSEDDSCCRWLKAVDNECVCELLFHLPPFLSRPSHTFHVHVDDSCDVIFTCEG